MGLLYTPEHGYAGFTVPHFDQFMLRAEQRVDNTGAVGVVVQPYALINRTDRTAER